MIYYPNRYDGDIGWLYNSRGDQRSINIVPVLVANQGTLAAHDQGGLQQGVVLQTLPPTLLQRPPFVLDVPVVLFVHYQRQTLLVAAEDRTAREVVGVLAEVLFVLHVVLVAGQNALQPLHTSGHLDGLQQGGLSVLRVDL